MTYCGQNRLYRNRGDGAFDDVTARAGLAERAHAVGHRLRLPRLRPRRPPRPLRGQLHRHRPRHRPTPDSGPLPLQGDHAWPAGRPGCRGEERPLPQQGRRDVRGRLRDGRASRRRAAPTASASAPSTSTTTAGPTCTWPTTRTPAALYRNNRDGTLHGRRRSPRAARTARTASRRRAWGWPSGTTTATGPWTSSRPTSRATPPRSTPTRGDGFCEDRTFAGGIGRQHALAGLGRGVRGLRQRRLAGPLPGATATSTPRWSSSRPRRATSSARSCTATAATAASRTSRSGWGRRRPTPRAGAGRRLRRLRQRRRRGRGHQQRARRARPLPHASDRPRTTGSPSSSWARARTAAPSARACAAWRAACAQVQEVRGGGSYVSQNDLRVHFGLGRPRRWTGWRCAGRTASRRNGATSPATGSVVLEGRHGDARWPETGHELRLPALLVLAWSRPGQDVAGDAPAGAERRARRGARPHRRGQARRGARRAARASTAAEPRVAYLLGVAYYHADDPSAPSSR